MDKARRKSRLLASIQRDMIRQFAAGVLARTAAYLSGVSRNTAILYFHKLRETIAANLAEEAPFLDGEVEVDESYFASRTAGCAATKSRRACQTRLQHGFAGSPLP